MTAALAVPMSMSSFAEGDISTPPTTDAPVSAVNKITVKDTVAGHTYEAYQIFSGDYDGTVLSNVKWGTGIDATKESQLLNAVKAISVGTEPTTTPFATCTSASDVAKVLGEITAVDAEITRKFAAVVGDYLSTSKVSATVAENATTCELEVESAGYYLVKDLDKSMNDKDDTYTRYIVKVAGETTVSPKGDKPTVIKKVKENNNTVTATGQTFAGQENYDVGENYNDVADYNIGDAVPFKLYGTLPAQTEYDMYEAYYYEFIDTLGSEFDAPTDVKVYVNGTEVTGANGNMRISVVGNSINVSFENVKLVAPKATDIITVEYTAVLNDTAKIGLPGQVNAVKLDYSNNPNEKYTPNTSPDDETPDKPDDKGETPEDKVIVFTYELDVEKIDGEDESKKLKDAEFQLYKDVTVEDNTTRYYYVTPAEGTTDRWVAGTLEGETWKAPTSVVTLTSDENGLFNVVGIDEGTYFLEEITPPTSYNKLDAPIQLDVTAITKNDQNWEFGNEVNGQGSTVLTALELTVDGETKSQALTPSDSDTFGANGAVKTQVKNNKGSALPSTGGIGTTLFYVVGGTLVAGAGVTLITKKRIKDSNK